MVEVGRPGVLPRDADVTPLLAEHTCRGEVADLDGSRSIVGRQHGDAAQVEAELGDAGCCVDVDAEHVDGLAVQGREVEAGYRPAAHGRRGALQGHVGLGGALRGKVCLDGDGALALVDDLIRAACGDGNLCLVEADEVVAGRQIAGDLEARTDVEGIVPVDADGDAGLLLNPPAPGGQHALHAGVVPVGRAGYLSAYEAVLAVAHTHVAGEGHGGDGRALQHTARYAGPSARGDGCRVGTEVHPHVLVVLEHRLGDGVGRRAVTVAGRLEGFLRRVLPYLRLGAEEVERAGVASRLGHGRVQVRRPSRVAFLRQLYAGIDLRERLRLRAAKLRGVAAVLPHGTVLHELRRVDVRLEDACVGRTRSVVPLQLHLRVGVVGHCCCVEVAEESFPFALRAAAGLFVDEPAVEAVVLCHLVELDGHRVVAVLRDEHLAYPFLLATEGSGREEDVAKRLHAALVSRVRGACGRDVDDALRGGTCPVDQLVHVLPVGRLVTQEVAQLTLRGAEGASGVEDGGVANLSVVELGRVGLHQGRFLEAGLQGDLCNVEGIVGVRTGRPVLDVLRVAAHIQRLLTESRQPNQKKGCG